jgi:predicted amidophosphoribosyltransferase
MCGFENAGGANFCNKCGSALSSDKRFEQSVQNFADEMVKIGKDVGEKAAAMGTKVAKDAKAFAAEVSKKFSPQPVKCPKCSSRIYETDTYCYNCGEKRS